MLSTDFAMGARVCADTRISCYRIARLRCVAFFKKAIATHSTMVTMVALFRLFTVDHSGHGVLTLAREGENILDKLIRILRGISDAISRKSTFQFS